MELNDEPKDMKPKIAETEIIKAAESGFDELLELVVGKTLEAIGGELNAQTMPLLSGEQITLLGYHLFREEVLDGGFLQLIHNGLGPFIFLNPFAKAMRLWGEEVESDKGTTVLHDFSKLIYKGRKLFERYGDELTRDVDDDEFMALFEQYPEFDDLDDAFVEAEEDITAMIAIYIDNHLSDFVEIKE